MLESFPLLEECLAASDARRLVLVRGLGAYPPLAERVAESDRSTAWLPAWLDAQPPARLIRGTPTFHHHLRRLYGMVAMQAPAERIAAAVDRVALAALDAFAGCAPRALPGRLPLPRLGGVQWLRLGLAFGAEHSPCAARPHATGLELAFDDGATLAVEAPMEAPAGALVLPLRRMHDASVSIGDSAAHLERDEAQVAALKPKLQASLEMIRRVSPRVSALIESEVGYFVPLVRAERAHYSFTLSDFPGFLFIGGVEESLSIVEAIVHETAHARLHHANESAQIAADSPAVRLYSPWRNDPRPTTGVVHAVYVFMLVLGFWLETLRGDEARRLDARGLAYVRSRVALVALQLEEAIAVLRRVELGELGRIVLDAAMASLPARSSLPVEPAELAQAQDKAQVKRERARAEHPGLVFPGA